MATADPLEPYRLFDAGGAAVIPVASFLRELLAASRAPLTLRSYAMDLLRWWRFLAAVDVRWEQATPVEGRDFSLWVRQASKPRALPVPGRDAAPVAGAGGRDRQRRPQSRREGINGGLPGQVNPVTGKSSPGAGMRSDGGPLRDGARTFYDFHRRPAAGRWSTRSRWTGPARRAQRATTTRWTRTGVSSRAVPAAAWRSAAAAIPDRDVHEMFACAAVAPGPGAGGFLGLQRGAGV